MNKHFIDCSYALRNVFYDTSTGKPVIITEKTRMEHALCVCRTGGGKTSLFLQPIIYETIQQKIKNRNMQQSVMLHLMHSQDVELISEFPQDSFCLSCFRPITPEGARAMAKLSNYCSDAAIVAISSDSSFANEIIEMCHKAQLDNYYSIDPENFIGDGSNSGAYYGLNPLYVSHSYPIWQRIDRINNKAEILAGIFNDLSKAISDEGGDPFFTELNRSLTITVSKILMLEYYNVEGVHPTLRTLLHVLKDYHRLEKYVLRMAQEFGSHGKPLAFLPLLNDSRVHCGNDLQLLYEDAVELVTLPSNHIKVSQAIGLHNALSNLLSDFSVARLLCDGIPLDLEEALASSAIILFNTAQKRTESVSTALGQIYISYYCRAVLQRQKDDHSVDHIADPPVFLFADEAASYLTPNMQPLVTLLRGYRASSYIAIQSVSQFYRVKSLEFLKDVFTTNPALTIYMGGMGIDIAHQLEQESEIVEKFRFETNHSGRALVSRMDYQYPAEYLNHLPFKQCALRLISNGSPQPLIIARTDWAPKDFSVKPNIFHWDNWLNKFRYEHGISITNNRPEESIDEEAFLRVLRLNEEKRIRKMHACAEPENVSIPSESESFSSRRSNVMAYKLKYET